MYRKEVQYIPTCDNIVQFKHEISHVMNLTNNKFFKKNCVISLKKGMVMLKHPLPFILVLIMHY